MYHSWCCAKLPWISLLWSTITRRVLSPVDTEEKLLRAGWMHHGQVNVPCLPQQGDRMCGISHCAPGVWSDQSVFRWRKALYCFIANGTVEVANWKLPTWNEFWNQWAQVHSCLYHYRGVADWVAFFDIDEYFQPLSEDSKKVVADVVQHLHAAGALGIVVRSVCF